MKDFSYITSAHPQFIEGLYQDYTKDPNSVDPELKKFFEGFDFALGSAIGKNGTNVTAASAASSNGSLSATVTSSPALSTDWM